MAAKTDSALTAEVTTITGETTPLANTAVRIGGAIQDLVDSKINVDKISSSLATDTGSTTKVPTVAAVEAGIAIGKVTNVKVTMSSAEILAGFTTPKVLVAAPGAGKFILPLSVSFMMKSGTIAYATQTSIVIGCGGVISTTASVLDNTPSNTKYFVPELMGISVANASNINAPLYATIPTADPTAGNGTIDFYISYALITV